MLPQRSRVRLLNHDGTAAHGLGTGLEGRLRVCAPVTFASIHLVPKLATFLESHRKLRLQLVMDDRTIDLLKKTGLCILQEG